MRARSVLMVVGPIAGVVAIVAMVSSQIALHASTTRLGKTTEALAFACGFRFGQVSIMNQMPALFQEQAAPGDSCPAIAERAAALGFTTSISRVKP